MTTGERLVFISTLTSDTALQHFLNISAGGNVINVIGLYEVEYLGEELNLVEYVDSEILTVEYIESELVAIEYLDEETNLIEYIENELLEIDISCQ